MWHRAEYQSHRGSLSGGLSGSYGRLMLLALSGGHGGRGGDGTAPSGRGDVFGGGGPR